MWYGKICLHIQYFQHRIYQIIVIYIFINLIIIQNIILLYSQNYYAGNSIINMLINDWNTIILLQNMNINEIKDLCDVLGRLSYPQSKQEMNNLFAFYNDNSTII